MPFVDTSRSSSSPQGRHRGLYQCNLAVDTSRSRAFGGEFFGLVSRDMLMSIHEVCRREVSSHASVVTVGWVPCLAQNVYTYHRMKTLVDIGSPKKRPCAQRRWPLVMWREKSGSAPFRGRISDLEPTSLRHIYLRSGLEGSPVCSAPEIFWLRLCAPQYCSTDGSLLSYDFLTLAVIHAVTDKANKVFQAKKTAGK